MAGSFAKFRVPQAIFSSNTPSILHEAAIPISTGITSVCDADAIRQTPDSRLPIDCATASVTSCPD